MGCDALNERELKVLRVCSPYSYEVDADASSTTPYVSSGYAQHKKGGKVIQHKPYGSAFDDDAFPFACATAPSTHPHRSIDDVDDVSSNDAVFRTVVDLTDAFLDRTEDGDRRDDENRDERERQKSILFVRLLPEDVGVLRAEKSEG